MANKPAYTISDQITLLKSRGMLFKDESLAINHLKNISYYRLKGYWWDTQTDTTLHTFSSNTYFENIIERYNFDKELRLIVFDAIEMIEVSLRTKMIHHLSISYGSLWYLNSTLFENTPLTLKDGTKTTIYQNTIDELKKEFNRSQEIFIQDHKRRYQNQDADSWKILEVASMGTLSKLFKNLKHQLPEKAAISKEMGLNLHSELSSWLESFTYVRNIIAHHSRLWSKNMVKKPTYNLKNPIGQWFQNPITPVQIKKPFLIISCMMYTCNMIDANNKIKLNLDNLFNRYQSIPIYKLGFLNNWKNEPLWI
jgi:abortive infection bacteriophage resistance protein